MPKEGADVAVKTRRPVAAIAHGQAPGSYFATMSVLNFSSRVPPGPSMRKARTTPSMRHSASVSPFSSTRDMSKLPVAGSPANFAAAFCSEAWLPYWAMTAVLFSSSPPNFRRSMSSSPPGVGFGTPHCTASACTVLMATRKPSESTQHCVGSSALHDTVQIRVSGPSSFVQTRSFPSAPPTRTSFRIDSVQSESTVFGTPLPDVQDLGTPRSMTCCWCTS
mmetsp:Transcript_81548/g.174767  ORF Transcript_81548/g.174767 Transcript_81548/m.174767 type:complete len:221 (+) Transcript_81548:381-1043(+)